MSRYLKVDSCKVCPFRGHSGGFTKGGPKLLCDNPEAERYATDLFSRPLLNPKSPTQWPEQIPDFCPLTKLESKEEIQKLQKRIEDLEHFACTVSGLWATDQPEKVNDSLFEDCILFEIKAPEVNK